uniref:Putative reeler n=1 Tax=Ixodes ricinus TaxID=34613 RepID=V5IEW0_IXORI
MALKVAMSMVLVFLSAGICVGHPDGADDEACAHLFPYHGYIAKSAAEGHAEGYRLVQDKEDYKPGDVITVTLSSEASPFMGFLIKAFDEDEKDVGQFVQLGAHSRLMPNCSAVTHTHPEDKTNILAHWRAPKDRRGKVHFKATVLKAFYTFYHAMPSTLPEEA